MDAVRENVHALIDELATEKLAEVELLLKRLLLPEDDEPVTDDDRRRVLEGKAWFAARGGRGIPMEQVLAEFGLTEADLVLPSENGT